MGDTTGDVLMAPKDEDQELVDAKEEIESSSSDGSASSDSDSDVQEVATVLVGDAKRGAAASNTAAVTPGAAVKEESTVGSRKKPRASAVDASSDDECDSVVSSDSDSDSEVSDLDAEEDVDQEPLDLGNEIGIYKDLINKPAAAPIDKLYRGRWSGAPPCGSKGFNAFATQVMRKAKVASGAAALSAELPTGKCPPLQPHQEVVQFLLHPQSPLSRLLVDHPTGSGKTREMISVLDNYFSDPRPKVPIFPKEPVCRNFYGELIRWPSRYRDFFSCLRPQDAARASGTKDWRERRQEAWNSALSLPDREFRELCAAIREVLELRGWFFMGKMRRSRRDAFERRFPGEPLPAAPLRALRYTSAGGRHSELGDNGLPISSLLKVGFDHVGKNAYSNKIVIMDEVHNLVRSQTQYGEQLERLRTLLYEAKGTVLAGFTGTPILSEPWEGRQLLDIVKGKGAPSGDGGFLSSFPFRPPELFPRSLPDGVPDHVMTPGLRRQFMRKVMLSGESLQKYDFKRQKGLQQQRLRNYCNLSVHFGSLHGGKNGSKARVLNDMTTCAPKLHLIAGDVAENPKKALVLVSRRSGLEALLAHLREVAKLASPTFGVATMDELSEFNSAANLRGEIFRVMIADATTCSEGVNFLAVRRVILADVP